MPNLANIDNPYEDQEQEAFVRWLDDNGYPRFRVPNETYTKSHKQRIKNKKLGVSSGVPDLFVIVPVEYSDATMDFIHYRDCPVVSGDGVVAFRRGKDSEASYGTVSAVKDGKAVIDTGASFFRETFILPFDELIVILPKTQEQSND